MCGIAAIFSYRDGRPVSESELLAIRDRMTSRGPDGAGIWISPDRSAGLAHRRLSILDLSPSGAQPMFDETGAFGISFNGEIYNYRELRAELKFIRFNDDVLVTDRSESTPSRRRRARGVSCA